MKENFTEPEWTLLKRLHFQVFALVAGSDGTIDRREMAELKRQLDTGGLVADPLHRRLLVDIVRDDPDSYRVDLIPNRMPAFASQVKGILHDHLSPTEYQGFIESLFASGLRVARSSGTNPLGFGKAVSKDERAALAAFAVQYDLDSDALQRRLGFGLGSADPPAGAPGQRSFLS